MTPDPDPVEFGIRSADPSRVRPGDGTGKMLTTEGFATSARSVMTVWSSSSSRRPGESLRRLVPVSEKADMRPPDSQPVRPRPRTMTDEKERCGFMMGTLDVCTAPRGGYRIPDSRTLAKGAALGRLRGGGRPEMGEPVAEIVTQTYQNHDVV